MTDFDFSEVTADSKESSSTNTSSYGGNIGQVHIKKEFGTETIHADECCHKCANYADVAVRMEHPGKFNDGTKVKITLCCYDHLGRVTEGLMEGPLKFSLHGFN